MPATQTLPARLIALGLALLVCLFAARAGAVEVPLLSGRVVDNAELLSPTVRNSIAAKLKAHEDKTGNQVVVLTIPSLEGDSIEPYAVKVFETWKLGKKGKDNGALLVVVPKERKLRIEVGYGLEGPLPDATTSRIIRNVIAPHFKAGNFDLGVDEGVSAIIGQLEGKGADAIPTPLAAESSASSGSGVKAPKMSLTARILFGVFVFGIIGLFTVIGVFTPGVGWFLYLFLIPFWAMFPIAIVGFTAAMVILAVYLIGFPIAKLLIPRSTWYQQRQLRPGRARRSRFDGLNHSSGSWSSSSGSGSWDSGESFSGGGGESGGGGSSGDF